MKCEICEVLSVQLLNMKLIASEPIRKKPKQLLSEILNLPILKEKTFLTK